MSRCFFKETKETSAFQKIILKIKNIYDHYLSLFFETPLLLRAFQSQGFAWTSLDSFLFDSTEEVFSLKKLHLWIQFNLFLELRSEKEEIFVLMNQLIQSCLSTSHFSLALFLGNQIRDYYGLDSDAIGKQDFLWSSFWLKTLLHKIPNNTQAIHPDWFLSWFDYHLHVGPVSSSFLLDYALDILITALLHAQSVFNKTVSYDPVVYRQIAWMLKKADCKKKIYDNLENLFQTCIAMNLEVPVQVINLIDDRWIQKNPSDNIIQRLLVFAQSFEKNLIDGLPLSFIDHIF